jgi:CheY-like chemotaxis protein
LIDDEEDVRYSLQRILATEDIELATAASGEEGLRVHP